MRRLLHLSDLHFGKINPQVLESLQRFIQAQSKNIELIVITGDWTQRARHGQFREAEVFVKSLPVPVISVPGNHDIPLYDLFTRWLRPWGRYNRYIAPWTRMAYADDEVALWGVQTPTRIKAVSGMLQSEEVGKAEEFFARNANSRWRILAGHHPEPLVGLLHFKPHIILSGHYHRPGLEDKDGQLWISAGSGTSTRLRGHENSFNLIEIGDVVVTKTYSFGKDGFKEI